MMLYINVSQRNVCKYQCTEINTFRKQGDIKHVIFFEMFCFALYCQDQFVNSVQKQLIILLFQEDENVIICSFWFNNSLYSIRCP